MVIFLKKETVSYLWASGLEILLSFALARFSFAPKRPAEVLASDGMPHGRS